MGVVASPGICIDGVNLMKLVRITHDAPNGVSPTGGHA